MAKRSRETSTATAAKRKKTMGHEVQTSETALSQYQSPLLKVAGEIRNKIYYYALDMVDMDEPRIFNLKAAECPVSRTISKKRHSSTKNILLACKRVVLEAGSLLYEHGT
jgi:hypothetical protein